MRYKLELVWTISLILFLGACRSTPPRPSELIGSWKATELSRGDLHAPLGRPYKVVFEHAGGNLFEVTLSGCNARRLVFTIDGARLTNSCGERGTLCTSTLLACFTRRINLDGSIAPDDEVCSDKLPYCRSRLRQDDELLISVFKAPSSWHFSKANLVVSSEQVNAQVTLQRDDDR